MLKHCTAVVHFTAWRNVESMYWFVCRTQTLIRYSNFEWMRFLFSTYIFAICPFRFLILIFTEAKKSIHIRFPLPFAFNTAPTTRDTFNLIQKWFRTYQLQPNIQLNIFHLKLCSYDVWHETPTNRTKFPGFFVAEQFAIMQIENNSSNMRKVCARLWCMVVR